MTLLGYVSARETKGNTNIEVNHSEKGKQTVCAGEFPESSKEQNSLTANEGALSDLQLCSENWGNSRGDLPV